jgi:hypothetical protein
MPFDPPIVQSRSEPRLIQHLLDPSQQSILILRDKVRRKQRKDRFKSRCFGRKQIWESVSISKEADVNVDAPLKDQRMATEVMTMTSLPSSHNASHIRNCWENGMVLTNKVMYHFVPQAEDEIMFRCYR